jgi:hypothetical protein
MTKTRRKDEEEEEKTRVATDKSAYKALTSRQRSDHGEEAESGPWCDDMSRRIGDHSESSIIPHCRS